MTNKFIIQMTCTTTGYMYKNETSCIIDERVFNSFDEAMQRIQDITSKRVKKNSYKFSCKKSNSVTIYKYLGHPSLNVYRQRRYKVVTLKQ